MTALTGAPLALHDQIPMTQEVYVQLRADFEQVEMALAALRARASDDAHDEDGRELFAMETARELQQLTRRREQLDAALIRAQIVPTDGTAVVGSRVQVRDGDDRAEEYVLVAPGEADPRAGRISIDSPFGQALVGRRAGETTHVGAPAGTRSVTVLQVQ